MKVPVSWDPLSVGLEIEGAAQLQRTTAAWRPPSDSCPRLGRKLRPKGSATVSDEHARRSRTRRSAYSRNLLRIKRLARTRRRDLQTNNRLRTLLIVWQEQIVKR